MQKEEEIKKLQKLETWFGEAVNATPERDWRSVAKEDYAFYAGEQDSEAILALLAKQQRPGSVYNEIKPKIDALVGLGSDVRLNATPVPVEETDLALADPIARIFKFHQVKVQTSETEQCCYEHAVKSGRSLQGWFIDTENPFDPKIVTHRIEGEHFYLDSNDNTLELEKSRYIFVEKWLDEDEIKVIFPKFDSELVKNNPHVGTSSESMLQFFNEDSRKFRVVECWYREFEKVVWFLNPLTEKPEFLKEKDWKIYVKNIEENGGMETPQGFVELREPPQGIPKPKKFIKYAFFTSGILLEHGDNPYTGFNADHFPYALYGAFKNDVRNRWFGAITMMKDPQRGFNTMLRQLMHLLQTLPKGILIHEAGTIINEDEYDTRSSAPNFRLVVKEGALARGAVKFETQPSISPVYGDLIAKYDQLMKDLSNVQDPLLAIQTTSREPGVTARMRQQSNIVALFTLFSNYKKSRMHAGRQLLSFIQQYLPQFKAARILGPQFAELMKTAPDLLKDLEIAEFDLQVEEGLEGRTMRLAIAQLLTEFSQNNPNAIPPDVILEYSDLPATVLNKVREFNQQQSEASQQEADREFDLEMRKIDSKIQMNHEDNVTQLEEAKIKLLGKDSDNGNSRGTNPREGGRSKKRDSSKKS
jgi:hypothetical protein